MTLKADGVAVAAAVVFFFAAFFEEKRDFSGHCEGFDGQAKINAGACQWRRLIECERDARHLIGCADIENRIGVQCRQNAVRAVDRKRLAFAQIDQAGDVIDVGIGHDDGLDRRIAQAAIDEGMQFRRVVDLLAQIGRRVEQHPVAAVG